MKQIASQGGALLVAGFFLFGAVRQASAQTLLPWINRDIGSPAADGTANVSAEKMVVAGAGAIGGTRDEFHFVYQRLEGDVDVTVRVNALDGRDEAAKVGIMIRNSLAPAARHAFVAFSPDKGLAFERRYAAGEHTRRTQAGTGAAPLWLRLVRKGDHFLAYRSVDGTSWVLAARDIIDMRASAYVGFAVASGSPERTAFAVFVDPTIDVDGHLPEPWATRQIGHTAEPGDAEVRSGSVVVQGAGRGVRGSVDRFRYVFQPVRGDVEIVARVASLAAPSRDATAGVMIRADLDDRGVHATLAGTLDGWEFQRRVTAGIRSVRTAGASGPLPGWVRLVREGHLFSAFSSPDGLNWTLVDSDRIAMPHAVLVGVAVASHNISELATASFTDVVVRPPVVQHNPPAISLLSPTHGQRFEVGASISIAATASDPDGAITRVDFYCGPTFLGSDTTAPYSATWRDATAGTHSLSAIARDTDGAAAIATVSVMVGSPSARATLVFSPSADHARGVTSYAVAVFRATDPVSGVPVARTNLGKPSPIGGEIAVDISALVAPLEAGSYKLVVTAIGPGGSAASTPSPSFAR